MTPLNDAVRIRVIRAILGVGSSEFAAMLGVSVGSLTSWEKGRCVPKSTGRASIARLCKDHNIGFLPSGMPAPFPDCVMFKKETQGA